MEFQFYGANCISINYKNTRIIVDDNLSKIGKKSVLKSGDVAIYTTERPSSIPSEVKIVIDCPGEYEVADVSIVGFPAKAHYDPSIEVTMYKITTNELAILVTGHISPSLNEQQLESIGMCDILVIPVGGHGYTLDAKEALLVVKEIEPKLVIPTHYDQAGIIYDVPQATLADAVKDLGMEPKETTQKLRIRPTDLTDVTQLIILEQS